MWQPCDIFIHFSCHLCKKTTY